MLSCSLERKEAFQDDKNVNFVKSKKWVFSKGVNFGQKIQNFFLSAFGQNKVRNNV